MFQSKINDILNPKMAKEATKKETSVKTTVESAKGSTKDTLQTKVALMAEIVANADETEAKVLEGVFGKMFGGK